ncbi:hypothetical protein ACWDA7_42800 [Streptomyces sp. NPDC001156]
MGYLLMTAGLVGYAIAHSVPTFLASTVCWSRVDLLLMGPTYAEPTSLIGHGTQGAWYGILKTVVARVTVGSNPTPTAQVSGP